MRFKIGNEWYSSDDQDLCVEFTENELDYIKNELNAESAPNLRFAAMRDDGRTLDQMRAWIRERDE